MARALRAKRRSLELMPRRINSGGPELATTDMSLARLARSLSLVLVSALAAAPGLLTAPRPAWAAAPLATAIYDPETFSGDQSDLAFARTKQAGASFVDIQIYWASVAPTAPPAGFRAADPADPAYSWSVIDHQVAGAMAHGLTPIVSITSSPRWAQGDPTKSNYAPDPVQYGLFAQAAARRYSGSFGGLPRDLLFPLSCLVTAGSSCGSRGRSTLGSRCPL